MVDLETFLGLANTHLDSFVPKPTSIEGNQVEATKVFWQSKDGLLKVGIWECTPGRFSADRTQSTEICHIISGKAELARHDGTIRTLGAGDLIILPIGWKGEWLLSERTRKLFVIQSTGG